MLFQEATKTEFVVDGMPSAVVYEMLPPFHNYKFIAVVKGEFHPNINSLGKDEYVIMPVEHVTIDHDGMRAEASTLLGHIEIGDSPEEILESFGYPVVVQTCDICGQILAEDNCQG
jgi:hypothetical protein